MLMNIRNFSQTIFLFSRIFLVQKLSSKDQFFKYMYFIYSILLCSCMSINQFGCCHGLVVGFLLLSLASSFSLHLSVCIVMNKGNTLYYIILDYIILHYIISYNIILYDIILYDIILYDIILYHIILHQIVLHSII